MAESRALLLRPAVDAIHTATRVAHLRPQAQADATPHSSVQLEPAAAPQHPTIIGVRAPSAPADAA